ncbi:MAG: pseudaminic acid synthase [Burkholderiales bacterium]
MNQPAIKIGTRILGGSCAPLVVAEMSGNHNQSLDRALSIVEAAAAAGAHALKIQTYTADTMTLQMTGGGFSIEDSSSLWSGRSLYDLYEEAHTPWEWHKPIFERCGELGMIGFSSPFDETAVDFLESLNVPCYKIASFEIVDIPLIRKCAATKKPLIISTGMATEEEIQDAVTAARSSGCTELVLLKCTSTYPASPENTNILTIPAMRQRFGCHVGLSDHTMGIGVAIASVALGAVIIEKHFTLRRADGGVDSAFSLEPEELQALVEESARAALAMGVPRFGPTEGEKNSLVFRRSLYFVEDLQPGEVLTAKNVRAIRPGYGLPPKHLDQILGKRVINSIAKGTPVSWDLVS